MLRRPREAHVLPFGVLALGFPADAPGGGGAEKPDEVCFGGTWGDPLV